MQISIIQGGRVLRTINHEGQTYVEAPTSGEYKLRVHNNSHRRRLAIVSVDGVNVVNGEDASFEGGGYVLDPWQMIDIPGFRRDDGTVAAFKFTEQGGSYAAKMGKGTKNVGVVGLAVFDEKVVRKVVPPPVVIHEHHHHYDDLLRRGVTPDWTLRGGSTTGDPLPNKIGETICNTADVGTEYGSSLTEEQLLEEERTGIPFGDAPMPCAAGAAGAAGAVDDIDYEPEMTPIGEQPIGARLDAFKSGDYQPRGGVTRRRRITKSAVTRDVGTGYGRQVRFNTMETTFTRATDAPVLVLSLRYATRARLESWGVPVEKPNVGPMAANPFPAASPSVPAPPGWRG